MLSNKLIFNMKVILYQCDLYDRPMFEKSYSGKCRWVQMFSSIWRSKDWIITLVQSVLFIQKQSKHTFFMSLCLILFTSQILYASPFSAQQKDKEKMLKDMMQKSDDVPPLVSIADELTMMWIEPMNQLPALYEKIEWGIQLPASVNKAIENWISNDLKQTNLRPAINPFDPEQIDLSATIQYSKDGKMISQPVNGFFYEEFDRITHVSNATSIPTLSDPNFWHWQSIPTPYTFRIRWSADALAEHQVKILLSVPSLGKWELPVFQFTSLGGSTKNSFISISSNKHYFKTDDDKLFFPVGINITEASFGCNCKEGVDSKASCDKCYEWANEDPCCGMDWRKKERQGIPGVQLNEYSLAAAAYVKLEVVLKALKEKGANAFRTFFDPMAFDIEFEKLNNYYDRQYQAWEFDRMLDVCHDVDLRIELNMQYHYSVAHHSFGYDRFDWDNTYNCIGCGIDTKTTGTNGWCYNNGCADTNDAIDFLSSPCALLNYKKKLRYIIARWGYSRNIFMLELMSEMNNIGGGSVWEVNVDTDGDGQKDDVIHHEIKSAYYKDPKNKLKVAQWHHEMARYIKEDLHHTRHLIAADYTGTPPMDVDLNGDGDCLDAEIGENCNPCQSDVFDNSWQSRYIDIIAFSNYSAGLNRWEKMSVHEYFKNSQSGGLMCGWNDPSTTEDDGKYYSPLGGYESLWKPVVHAENGLTSCLSDDYTGFVKDMLTDTFGGHASSGMSWDEWSETTNWHYLGSITKFLNEKVMHVADFGKGNWKPAHSYSAFRSRTKKTKFAESIYTHETLQDVFVGFVINRSWNYYTQCPGSCATEERKNDFSGVDQPLATFTPVNGNTDKIFLKGAIAKKYLVRYYDPQTGNLIKEVFSKGARGKVELEDYPTLGNGKEGAQPFYYFIITAM